MTISFSKRLAKCSLSEGWWSRPMPTSHCDPGDAKLCQPIPRTMYGQIRIAFAPVQSRFIVGDCDPSATKEAPPGE